jgi:hypothetical protein
MTSRFQGGRSSRLAKPTVHTVPHRYRHNSNTNPTRATKASNEKRQGHGEDQDPHKSPQRKAARRPSALAPSAHNSSSERYPGRPDRDSNAGPTA